MIRALSETTIGRALLAFWEDMPLWVVANIGLAASLWLSVRAGLWGRGALALILSFPAVFVVAGLSNTLSQSARERAPHWRDLLHGPYRVTLSLWAVLALTSALFSVQMPPPVFWALCVLTAVTLILSPLVLAVSALYPVGIWLAWRNAFGLAVRFPVAALGLLALAFIFGLLTAVTRGGLLLIVPALWLDIAIFSTSEMVEQLQ